MSELIIDLILYQEKQLEVAQSSNDKEIYLSYFSHTGFSLLASC